MIVGIDATNIRVGGGLTHLREVLTAAEPAAHGIARVVVWSGRATLEHLPDRPWLVRESAAALDGPLWQRSWWQRWHLDAAVRAAGCQVLFVPGGAYAGRFAPVVTFHQNLLPFTAEERRRFGWSLMRAKMTVLRHVQARTFRQADGIIFLTRYAEQVVRASLGHLRARSVIVPHGVDVRFLRAPRPAAAADTWQPDRPCRLLYVSPVFPYKHHAAVVDAVVLLHQRGRPVALDLVGPVGDAGAWRRLDQALARANAAGARVRFLGGMPYEALPEVYAAADIALLASSCESYGQILTEAMASGVPIAAADRSAIPEVLGAAGTYFDPEQPVSIAEAVGALMADPARRAAQVRAGYDRVRGLSWQRTAAETLAFLAQCALHV